MLLVQRVAADQQSQLLRVTREEQGRLAGGVAAAHHDDRVAGAYPGLHQSRGVVDAVALELLQPRHLQPAVACAAGHDDRAGRSSRSSASRTRWSPSSSVSATASAGIAIRHRTSRLDRRELGEFGARDPGRETEVVLDFRRRRRLSARRDGCRASPSRGPRTRRRPTPRDRTGRRPRPGDRRPCSASTSL